VAMICTKETPTGSLTPVTKCRTPEQIAADRAAVDAAGNQIGRAGSGVRGPRDQ
jgi:hypothetical protein